MAFFRWLFHPLLWLVLVLALIAWLYRDSLLPEQGLPNGIVGLGERVEQLLIGVVGEEPITPDASAKVETPVAVQPQVAEKAQEPSPAPVVLAGGPKEEARAPLLVPQQHLIEEVERVEPPPLPAPAVEVVEVVEVSESQREAATGPSKSPDHNPQVLWYQARSLAWDGEWEASVATYQKLLSVAPENFDAHGEMGNVYLLMGDVDAAVRAYTQAALVMSRAGYPQVAWNVLGVVSRLDQQQGEALYHALREQQLSAVP